MNAPFAGKDGKAALAALRTILGQRRPWYALAASLLTGVLLGTLLWVNGATGAVAKAAVAHVVDEPVAMVRGGVPVAPERLREVLHQVGARWRADPGLVSYARSCPFRGHSVPHLVVQTADGPVALLVLRKERVPRTLLFRERGYAGRLEPLGTGAIAIIGESSAPVGEEEARRLAAAIAWETP